MSRRIPTSRRPSIESLEVRCNPAALDPLAGFVAEEPAPVQTGTHYFEGRFLRAEDLSREQASIPSNTNSYFTNDYSLTVGDSSAANLSAFAGQTIRLRIATTNNQGKLIVGVDDVQLRANTSQDSATGGAGLDVLIGNTGGDRVFETYDQQGRLLIGTDGGIWRNSPDDTNRLGTHVESDFESILDDLARDVASHLESRSTGELASFLAFPGFTGSVSVAAGDVNGDVNGDGVDDILTGIGSGAGPHVKLSEGGMATITLTRTGN